MTAPDAHGYSEPPPEEDQEPSCLDRLRDQLLDSGGLDRVPEPAPLVEGILSLDSLGWLQGKRSNCKSFVGLDIAGCVGAGHHWHGHAVTQGRVLFIAAEGVSGMRWRVRAWEKSYGVEMADVQFLPMPVQVDNTVEWNALIELATEIQPKLIVIDTQARITVGMEENAAKDMGVFVHRLEQLRRACHACVLVIHHMGRNGEHMRGSTALEGAATTILQVVKEDAEITLSCEKQKDAEEFDDIHLKLVPVGDSAVLMPSDGISTGRAAATRTAREWWNLFGHDRVSVSRLVKAEVASERTIYRHIKDLGPLVEKVEFGGHNFYRLTANPSGREL